jgi:hypothetical protein
MIKILTFLCLLSTPCLAQDLVASANGFLNSLDEKLNAKARYTMDNPERFNWYFVPRDRNGVSMRNLSDAQRKAALAMLKASLSDQGYGKAAAIMELEILLKELEARGPEDNYRDPTNYYITIFGEPSKVNLWGWRFEGHHISFSFTSDKNKIVSSTPSFFGNNPGIVPRGPEKGKSILKQETDLGYELCNSFTTEQKAKVIFSETAPNEIITSNKRSVEMITPTGLLYQDMTDSQQKLFLQLLNTYVKNYELGFANTLMAKIKKAGMNTLSFSWAGALTPGGGANYYRIQSPVLLIEYDNSQNNANHIHTVVRDFTNDFAGDILREHYQNEKH